MRSEIHLPNGVVLKFFLIGNVIIGDLSPAYKMEYIKPPRKLKVIHDEAIQCTELSTESEDIDGNFLFDARTIKNSVAARDERKRIWGIYRVIISED